MMMLNDTILRLMWHPFVCGLIGVILLPFSFITFLLFLGFTTFGVSAGSFAAFWMACYGGNVIAGSIFALFQSFGAIGMSAIFPAFAVIGFTIFFVIDAGLIVLNVPDVLDRICELYNWLQDPPNFTLLNSDFGLNDLYFLEGLCWIVFIFGIVRIIMKYVRKDRGGYISI
jgi:hypothetical protein